MMADNISIPVSPADWVLDSDGSYVGVAGNIDEGFGTSRRIQNAVLKDPPLPVPLAPKRADIGAFWYQDFGIEYGRIYYPAPYYLGWMGWYDWRWNFRRGKGYAGQGYYPDRHPTLGWYRGDDPKVLGWQAKWLVEHGCDWAVIQQRAVQPDDGGNWTDETNVTHWVYQLLNIAAVRAGLLKLCFWLPHAASTCMAYGPHSGIWNSTAEYGAGLTVVTFNAANDPTYYLALTTNIGKEPAANPSDWSVIPAWNAATTYTSGQRVQYTSTGKFFVAIAPSTGVTPGNNASWQVVSDWNNNANLSWVVGQVVINTAFDNRQYRCIQAHANAAGAKQPNTNPAYWELVPMPAAWSDFVAFHAAHKDAIKTTTDGGLRYATVFVWSAEVCRVYWGNGSFLYWLRDLGAAMHAAVPEWDGVAPLMNNSPSPSVHNGQAGAGSINYDTALAGRALLLRTDYPGFSASTGAVAGANGYQSLIDNFTPAFSTVGQGQAIDRRVYTVPTSAVSLPPHGSAFNYQGHAPGKFQTFLGKAVAHCEAGNGYSGDDGKGMVLIYNVSEWTEGGPGLQPNRKDGFGYLTAMKAVQQGG